MPKIMSYNECLQYVMEHKLRTYRNPTGVWTVAGSHEGVTRSVDAPDYTGAVNTWKANYGEPCDAMP